MTLDNQILNKAKKEIAKLKEDYDKLYREFSTMKLYANTLEKDNNKMYIELLKHFVNTDKQPIDIDDLSLDAEIAMTKYTNKLRKENAKYAKQKQSKRQQT